MAEPAADEIPEPEEILGRHPEYIASMQRLLAVTDEFQRMLDSRQLRKWLEVEDALLEHFSFVQRGSYQAGREGMREAGRREQRTALLALLASLIEQHHHSQE